MYHSKYDPRTEENSSLSIKEINFSIFIIATGDDYWPFPWYLRDMDNVGYWNHVPHDVGLASIILISSDLTDNLAKIIYENVEPGLSSLFIPLFEEMLVLRPGIEINVYVKKDVYDLFERLSSNGR